MASDHALADKASAGLIRAYELLAEKYGTWSPEAGTRFFDRYALEAVEGIRAAGEILAALRAAPAESAGAMREPSPGLLMSMAIRYDHGLGMPGYYDQEMFRLTGSPSHADHLRSTLSTMRQLWEEVSGCGFYRPAKEADYVALRDRALSDQPTGGPDAG